jgi:CubicO group peptidase (beta-lactamase class C family)
MNPRGVLMRMSRKKLLLISAAFAIAAVAALGPGGGGSGGAPSSAKALSYVTGHRLDLGAPGIAVGVVTDKGMSTASAGDVTVDTPIPVGSVTKSFTALAVMQLAEAGKLKLDEPVVRYLPTFTHQRHPDDRRGGSAVRTGDHSDRSGVRFTSGREHRTGLVRVLQREL